MGLSAGRSAAGGRGEASKGWSNRRFSRTHARQARGMTGARLMGRPNGWIGWLLEYTRDGPVGWARCGEDGRVLG